MNRLHTQVWYISMCSKNIIFVFIFRFSFGHNIVMYNLWKCSSNNLQVIIIISISHLRICDICDICLLELVPTGCLFYSSWCSLPQFDRDSSRQIKVIQQYSNTYLYTCKLRLWNVFRYSMFISVPCNHIMSLYSIPCSKKTVSLIKEAPLKGSNCLRIPYSNEFEPAPQSDARLDPSTVGNTSVNKNPRLRGSSTGFIYIFLLYIQYIIHYIDEYIYIYWKTLHRWMNIVHFCIYFYIIHVYNKCITQSDCVGQLMWLFVSCSPSNGTSMNEEESKENPSIWGNGSLGESPRKFHVGPWILNQRVYYRVLKYIYILYIHYSDSHWYSLTCHLVHLGFVLPYLWLTIGNLKLFFHRIGFWWFLCLQLNFKH